MTSNTIETNKLKLESVIHRYLIGKDLSQWEGIPHRVEIGNGEVVLYDSKSQKIIEVENLPVINVESEWIRENSKVLYSDLVGMFHSHPAIPITIAHHLTKEISEQDGETLPDRVYQLVDLIRDNMMLPRGSLDKMHPSYVMLLLKYLVRGVNKVEMTSDRSGSAEESLVTAYFTDCEANNVHMTGYFFSEGYPHERDLFMATVQKFAVFWS